MTKATRTAPRQTAVSVAGVAVAVALLLVVTALGLGLVQETTVRSDAVDYWVVPQSADVSTMVVSAGEPQLGDVHRKSATLTRQDRIEYATPILVSVVQVESGGKSEYVLGIGVIPSSRLDRVAGLPTAPLSPGDQYFTNGSYDGEWTGEAVLSEGAADRLNVSTDANLTVSSALSGGGGQNLEATAVEPAAVESGLSGLPVMVVHLSELQAITGAKSTDQADQILVKSTTGGLKPELEDRFPGTTVVTRTGFTASNAVDSDLSLAMALAALIIAIVVGSLFVATTQGLQVEADSEQLATLTAIGFSRRARAALLVVQALALTLVGGTLGIALAYVTTQVMNYVATRVVGPVPIATFHPLLVGYGFGVAALIGILVAPYLLAMERRSEGVTEVMR
ncbi:ABC transporter permease [Haladaptatus sp. NG-SE-30]